MNRLFLMSVPSSGNGLYSPSTGTPYGEQVTIAKRLVDRGIESVKKPQLELIRALEQDLSAVRAAFVSP